MENIAAAKKEILEGVKAGRHRRPQRRRPVSSRSIAQDWPGRKIHFGLLPGLRSPGGEHPAAGIRRIQVRPRLRTESGARIQSSLPVRRPHLQPAGGPRRRPGPGSPARRRLEAAIRGLRPGGQARRRPPPGGEDRRHRRFLQFEPAGPRGRAAGTTRRLPARSEGSRSSATCSNSATPRPSSTRRPAGRRPGAAGTFSSRSARLGRRMAEGARRRRDGTGRGSMSFADERRGAPAGSRTFVRRRRPRPGQRIPRDPDRDDRRSA